MLQEKPLLGIGIIIENKKGEVLIGRRIGSHAEKYSIPGGAVELGETFEEAAIREAQEEHGIKLINPKVVGITNNLQTFKEEGFHSASVILVARSFEGTPQIMEPDKCSEILWCNPLNIPNPHFDASKIGLQNYISGVFYSL